MSALQRREIARNAAQVRWKPKLSQPFGSSPNSGCPSTSNDQEYSGSRPVYPLLVKNPPLRVRIARDALEQKGFQVAQKAWQLGNFAHLECSAVGQRNLVDDPRQLISKSLRGVGLMVEPENIRIFHFGKNLVVPIRVSGSAAAEDFVHSGDYHTIDYQGHLYTVPDRAAAMIKFLHEAYDQGYPWCSAQAIRVNLEMKESQRIDHLFRRQDGPQARKDLICSDRRRRRYRLNLPDTF
jgi:hypothetical protein